MCFSGGGGQRKKVGRGWGGGEREGALQPKKKKKSLSSPFLLAKTKRGTESAKFVKEPENVQKSGIKRAGEGPTNFEQRTERRP